MSLQENKALVRRFVEEMQNQHDLAALDEFFSPDFVDHGGMANPPNLEGAKSFFVMWFAAFPDQRFTIQRQLAEGDKVMTHKTFQATHLGPFMGIPATGKPVTFDLIDIFTVAGGMLTEHWLVADFHSLMQQLGAPPASE
jgi:predicted ester cyclase